MGINVIMFCLGDKWQDWESKGFANRSANVAWALSRHPAVDTLVVVNNPTSYVRTFVRWLSGGLAGRKLYRRSIHGYFLDEVSPKTTVIEQIRLMPRERSHRAAFLLNGLLHDGELIRLVKDMVAKKPPAPLILWLNSPVFAKLTGEIGEDLVVYDARDDWLFHPQLQPIRRMIADGYRLIGERADLIFAVSRVLARRFGGGRSEVHVVPNGIDCDLFSPAGVEIPAELANLPRPIIGYVGKMQQRFDVGFVAGTAALMPEASFVLVGPVFTPDHFKHLERMTNVHFLGRKHQSLIPGYIEGFDVCMMSHTDDNFTAAMNPLKLYEYLAMGKPTICTKVRGLEQFRDLIMTAPDPKSFVKLVGRALSEPEEKKRERMDFARRQGWQGRVDRMIELVNNRLNDKGIRSDIDRSKF
ncbi:MAG: glycosyltransferase [Actinobacteria bacterium]|nr:glycosyltransferase [Actinomycetota bacterium]